MDAAVAPAVRVETAVHRQRLVLVVDESRAQRRMLAASLSRWGYRVIEADSGEAAIALCRRHPVDMVMSGWVLPGMSGLELCRQFRALPREGYGYFILLTSRSTREDVAQGLEVGADEFLAKPVSLHELRARLTAAERILVMEEALKERNRALGAAFDKLRRMTEAIERDLEEARALQQALLRDRHQHYGPFEASLLLRPSGHVGGDMVGVIDPGGDTVAFFALDVSGHGIASALLTARLHALLSGSRPGQNIALESAGRGAVRLRAPADVVADLNRILLEEMHTDHYCTLVLACLHVPSGRVELVQAGHPHPFLQRAGGRIEEIGAGGFPVGLVAEARYEATSFTLAEGDRLLILSDGLTEATGVDGRPLDEGGLARLLEAHRHLRGPRFFDAILWEVDANTAGPGAGDDVSAILLDHAGNG